MYRDNEAWRCADSMIGVLVSCNDGLQQVEAGSAPRWSEA